ncbi:hypothetical protein BDR26DRAFT_902577 [Obelidium mucronatum]|nr:hypothetical protein BDR26DRAFT_902577 [Obelidium mucronatum]
MHQLAEAFDSHLGSFLELMEKKRPETGIQSLKAPFASIPLPEPHYIGYLPTYNKNVSSENQNDENSDEYSPPNKFNRTRQKSLAWKSTLKAVKTVCEILVCSMQDFWRLGKVYSEERKKTQETGTTLTAKHKRRADVKKMLPTMIRHIIELYSTVLDHCFHTSTPLSDLKKTSYASQNNLNQPDSDAASFLPRTTS